MGTFSVTVAIGSRDGQTFRDVDALVDTGASFSSMPRAILEEMGHVSVGKEEFELADGRIEEMDLAEVPIRIGDKVRTSLCTFRDADGAILGALTLEQFLLAVDPHNRRLVPVRGLMMGQHSKKYLRGRREVWA